MTYVAMCNPKKCKIMKEEIERIKEECIDILLKNGQIRATRLLNKWVNG